MSIESVKFLYVEVVFCFCQSLSNQAVCRTAVFLRWVSKHNFNLIDRLDESVCKAFGPILLDVSLKPFPVD